MEIQERCPSFCCKGVDEKIWTEVDFAGNQVLVIMFLSVTCPYVLALEERIINLTLEYQPQGVGFVAICSNTDPDIAPGNSFEDVHDRWLARNYSFPYLYDETQSIARSFAAECTPDFFVFDEKLILRYRGRFDDCWSDASNVTERSLAKALNCLLKGQPIVAPHVHPFGCAIKWNEQNISYSAERLRLSTHIRRLKRGSGEILLIQPMTGAVVDTSEDMLTFLQAFRTPTTLEEVNRRLALPSDVEGIVETLVEDGFLVRDNTDEKAKLKQRIDRRKKLVDSGGLISILRLNLSTRCNFRCTYCYMEAPGVNRSKSLIGYDMPWEIAKKSVDIFFRNLIANGKRSATVRHIGGEPLINREVLSQTMDYCQKQAETTGIMLTQILCTNGVLIDQPLIGRLKNLSNVHVIISLDGLPEHSDRLRVYSDGRGTYNDIVSSIKALLRHEVSVSIATVVNRLNYLGLEEFIERMAVLGVKRIGLNPEYYLGYDPFDRMSLSDLVDVLDGCRSRAQQLGVELSGKGFLAEWHTMHNHLANCEGMGRSLVVDPDGSITVCDKLNEKLGMIDRLDDMLRSQTYQSFAMRVRGNIKGCRDCDLEWMCNGGCAAEIRLKGAPIDEPAAHCEIIKAVANRFLLPL